MDRFLIAAAFNYVARRYHSGQNSIGYRKLSQLARMHYVPGCECAWDRRGSDERRAAAALLWKRRREIRLQW